MEVSDIRVSGGVDVGSYQIDIDEVKEAVEFLRQNHPAMFRILRAGVEGGIGIVHALRMVEGWNPNESVEISDIKLVTRGLLCFRMGGFARYYVGLKGGVERRGWAHMSLDTLNMRNQVATKKSDKRVIRCFAKRNNPIMPKFIGEVACRPMIGAVERRVAMFIHSRFGELSVSEARHEDLPTGADQTYPNCPKLLEEEFRALYGDLWLDFLSAQFAPEGSMNLGA